MCGNFGLLSLQSPQSQPGSVETMGNSNNERFQQRIGVEDDLDRSMTESMHQVSKLHGLRVRNGSAADIPGIFPASLVTTEELDSPLKILEAQTAATEIRGGQAGGYSSIEYRYSTPMVSFDSTFGPSRIITPLHHRVRMVAQKRHPLAAALSNLYLRNRSYQLPDPKSTITVIGHTRFATSSINEVPELHPHEWSPFHEENVWIFDHSSGKFERHVMPVGIHISHNGDFDAMEAYTQTMVNEDIGLWLERILHVPNDTKGDSPKIAGCMELLRVQGRWAAAARLSWVRCILNSSTDVSGGNQLKKSAPYTFPSPKLWELWGDVFDSYWQEHLNNVIKVISPANFDVIKRHQYQILSEGSQQFVNTIVNALISGKTRRQPSDHGSVSDLQDALGITDWTSTQVSSFVHHAVRGFLRGDLYTAMVELLSRAEGSFGLQVHCSVEPGVVVIASKGQPMSFAFDPSKPIVLFASEAEALAVPVYKSGKWLPERIDLDSHGEVFRVGEPKSLIEGNFSSGSASKKHADAKYSFLLDCGVEIRGYSLVTCSEIELGPLLDRRVPITSAPIPYDASVDLVAADLKVTPAVIEAIDHAWSNPASVERRAGQKLAESLVRSMQRRIADNKDTTDLLIGGIEVSLWLGEQFAADMRRIFPNLNVATVSTNKLLGVGDDNPSKVFFPGTDEILSKRIDSNTCVLLISQSGQTFPTLHATRKLAKYATERLWLLTGCFNSKMEQALADSYRERGLVYEKARVFNNYSGHRPAEPSSVAVAATWHSLTRLLLNCVDVSRILCPGGRIIHPWDFDRFATVIQNNFRRYRYQLLLKKRSSGLSIDAVVIPLTKKSVHTRRNSSITIKITNSNINPQVVMRLSDGCIQDIRSMLADNLIGNISQIVGYDQFGQPVSPDTEDETSKEGQLITTHERLVQQGHAWADHINETWHVLVLVGVYLFFSVGLGLPLFGLLADAVLAIVRAAGGQTGEGIILFAPRFPYILRSQSLVYSLVGLVVQCIDAVFFIYLGKNFTRWTRILYGRPLAARHGKRTIVIVDAPCVHQLVESFVSKLFSQSYSMISVDVHGASGLDHFVHRFTHRVVRGLLIAVGRPDGRLCCLAKSEASLLLAVKQAAFIRNPEYQCEGSGPEIVTIGHNPYEPNLGLASNIVLHNGGHSHASVSMHGFSSGYRRVSNGHRDESCFAMNRRKFVDEYLYDRLFLAKKPFTTSILRSLRRSMDAGYEIVRSRASVHGRISSHSVHISNHSKHSKHSKSSPTKSYRWYSIRDEPLPYGVHHIDPTILAKSNSLNTTVFADFVRGSLEFLKSDSFGGSGNNQEESSVVKTKSNDPAVRMAFSSKLDSQTRQIQDLQNITQQFYECRVAALERYLAFCVMFHAMATKCAKPWLLVPWDVARSQSNLRVATTASPISAGEDGSHEVSQEAKRAAHQIVFRLRKILSNF